MSVLDKKMLIAELKQSMSEYAPTSTANRVLTDLGELLSTNLIDRGMSLQEVAAILGHSKLDTTMTYVYINQRNTENSYRRYACM